MTRPLVDPLSTELERLLAAERDLPPLPPELRARVTERARVTAPAANVTPSSFFGRPWLVAAAALVVAAVAVAALQRLGSDAPVSSLPASSAHETHGPAPSAASTDAPVETAPGKPAHATEPRTTTKSDRDAPPRRSTSADAQSLELGILQRARAAVAGGNFSAALAAIAEHHRRFPSGILREEREALRVKALQGAGNTDEARKAARRFRETFPNSVLSPRLDEATREGP